MAKLFKNGSKTCIQFSELDGIVRYTPLEDSGLELYMLYSEEFLSLGWIEVNYDVKVAVERYLSFGERHGIAPEALEELLKIVREGESPVNERRVYSDGAQSLINVSPIEGPNINFVGILNGKLDLIPLNQKEFKKFKELKNQVKDFAKKLMKFAELEGAANKSAPRLLQEIIKGGPLINFEKESEMARKKAEPKEDPKAEDTHVIEKAEKGKSLMAEKKAKKVPAKKATKEKPVAEDDVSRGKKSTVAHMKIKVLVKKPDVKEGTHRYEKLQALLTSKTVAEAQEKVAGIDAGTLKREVAAGYLSLS